MTGFTRKDNSEYHSGYKAFANGEYFTTNPYHERTYHGMDSRHKRWNLGWDDAWVAKYGANR